MRIYIGWDARETIAYHVLSHSILTRTTEPVAISPVGNDTLPGEVWRRGRGPYDSTDFSNARFMVPYLAGYQGWALFMDCDMLCLEDIGELWQQRDPEVAVMVRKHNHVPASTTKFLGQPQARYARKNWSSLMLFNCDHPDTRTLTTEYVNNAAGLDLHGFAWTSHIGEVQGAWNELVLEGRAPAHALLPHFTEGGPWHGHVAQAYADDWLDELDRMVSEGNPRAESRYARRFTGGAEEAEYEVRYTRRG